MFFLCFLAGFWGLGAQAADSTKSSSEVDSSVIVVGSGSVIIKSDIDKKMEKSSENGVKITEDEAIRQSIYARSFALVLKFSGMANGVKVDPRLDGFASDEMLVSQYFEQVRDNVGSSDDEVAARKKMYEQAGVSLKQRLVVPFRCVFVPKKVADKVFVNTSLTFDKLVDSLAGLEFRVFNGVFGSNSRLEAEKIIGTNGKMIQVIGNFGTFVYFFEPAIVADFDDEMIRDEISGEKVRAHLNALTEIFPVIVNIS